MNIFRICQVSIVCLAWAACVEAQERITDEQFRAAREKLVTTQIAGAGVKNPRVLQAMRDTLRHEFVPKALQPNAYLDAGLPIGDKQTISSPFIVAFMTEALDPQPTDKVLEIGTGSGYQAAVLSPLVQEVYTIEIVETLGRRAEKTLQRLDYKNVFVKVGDGYLGWEEHAPYDKIIVTCSPENVPQPLVDQLREGGLIVIPVGERHQQTLHLFQKENGEMVSKLARPTLFVPMTGEAEEKREVLPDPARPEIVNPDFEMPVEIEGQVPGWYYERLCQLEKDATAPSGEQFLSFKNDISGQRSHLMQGLAIDGRQVSRLDFGATVKYEQVVQGPDQFDKPVVALTFYDSQRKEVGTEYLGPFEGTKGWQPHKKEIRVPVSAREAIVRIGLFGATGKISFDNIVIRKAD